MTADHLWLTLCPVVVVASVFGGWLLGRRSGAKVSEASSLASSAERSKGIFLANMDQELRRPLSAILGFSNLMRSDPSATPDQRRTLEIIEGCGDRLLALIDSAFEEGSEFRVAPPDRDAGAPAQARARTGTARLEPGQPLHRVLIMDDDPECSQLLRLLLEQAGFHVRVAESCADGLEAFRSWRPHFIWLDCRMAGMDGLEATRRIRALDGGSSVKIAGLSASDSEEERELALAAGADDFVRKPFLFGAIYGCMARQLGLRFLPVAPPAPALGPPAALDLEAIAGLSAALRKALADAVVSLDPARISSWIRLVTESHPALGAALEQHAGRFQYTAIWRALQSVDRDATSKDQP